MNNENMYTLENEQIPHMLTQIPQVPKKLFVKGHMPRDDAKILCIVGSRKNSSYGEKAVSKIVLGLQGYNICIVSGLALGIDGLVHKAALEAKLQTIAFPGSGLDSKSLYPAFHKKLADEILYSGGALISEFEMNAKAAPWMFPQRNRLMAGFSHATIVVEARPKSGTLITARLALDYNRDVGVIPGEITSSLSEGPNSLLREGAIPITGSEDVLEMLGFARPESGVIQPELFSKLDNDERKIIKILQTESSATEVLAIQSGLNIKKLNEVLSVLEIQGIVKEKNGKFSIV